MAANWKLSPSDFAFLWLECRRCFYLKVARQVSRPHIMPGIFSKIDSLQKRYFAGKSTQEITPALPPGAVAFGDRWVESGQIAVPGHASTCYIRGRFDSVLKFEDGSYGVIDFKTSGSNRQQASKYAWQLHSYAYALENPAPGQLGLAPVSKLGLLCIEPVEMLRLEEGAYAYRAEPTWIDLPRDDVAFLEFLQQVLSVLDLPAPPEAADSCGWCQYRDAARHNLTG